MVFLSTLVRGGEWSILGRGDGETGNGVKSMQNIPAPVSHLNESNSVS